MYPVSFEADIPTEGRNRLSTFFRIIYAIPILIVASILGIIGYFAAIIAWFALVITGKYPQGLYDFNAKVVRILSRTNAYYYLATDEYPAFNGDDDPSYPVRVGIAPPLDSYSRVKVFLRSLIGIPVLLLNYVWQIILSVVGIIAWLAIVITGKLPEGLVSPMRGGLAYGTKANAYYIFLLTEDYPPFSDDGGTAPAGQISSGTKTEA